MALYIDNKCVQILFSVYPGLFLDTSAELITPDPSIFALQHSRSYKPHTIVTEADQRISALSNWNFRTQMLANDTI